MNFTKRQFVAVSYSLSWMIEHSFMWLWSKYAFFLFMVLSGPHFDDQIQSKTRSPQKINYPTKKKNLIKIRSAAGVEFFVIFCISRKYLKSVRPAA